MAADATERAASTADAATERIRDLNEQILERIKSGGETALGVREAQDAEEILRAFARQAEEEIAGTRWRLLVGSKRD